MTNLLENAAIGVALMSLAGAVACGSSADGGAQDPLGPVSQASPSGDTDGGAGALGTGSSSSGAGGSGAGGATGGGPGTDAGPVVPPPPMVMPTFVVGYDEAWFGSHFGSDLTTDFDLAYVNKTFDGIVAGGGHVVRIFLFPLLQGVALGATTPQTGALSPTMMQNLGAVLDAARARGLWVYVTALEGNQMSKVVATKTYYTNLMNDVGGEGQAFLTNVYVPLLATLDAHKENVFGLDLVNEIDAPKSDGLWSDPTNGMRAYVQRTTAFVKSKSPWLRVTATVGWGGVQYDLANGLLSGLGLDFYDLHVYSDDGTYGGETALCQRVAQDGIPIYLGEFGQKSHNIDDTLQYNATAAFLNGAKSMCFSGALAWRYDSAENWWAFIRADGTLRPAAQIMKVWGAAK